MLFDAPVPTRARGSPSTGHDGAYTVTLVVSCLIIHWLSFAALPLLLPLIREDFEISFTQAGMLSVAGALSYTLCQVPSGYLADRFGPKRLFFIGLLGWSLLSVSFGLIHAFWFVLLNQFVAGAFRAMVFVPGLTLLAAWFPRERRATAMSLALVGGAVGSVLLSLIGPWLAQLQGWRATYIAFATLGIGAACVFGFAAKDNPGARPPRPATLVDVLQMARFPIMWVCSGLQFVRFAIVTGFSFWLPSFLVAERGMSMQVAGLVMAMSAALSAPSNALD
jgi:MFS family permease